MIKLIPKVYLGIMVLIGVIVSIISVSSGNYDSVLYAMYVLTILGVAHMLGALVYTFVIGDIKALIQFVVFVGGLGVLLGISYGIANGTEVPVAVDSEGLTEDQLASATASAESVSRWVGASLYTFYFLIIGTILAIVGSESYKAIK